MASTEKTILTGQLKRWNEAKGFGFISTKEGQRDIFIHISDLKGMSRRPQVGDTIHYQVKVQDDGKNRAINARIEGVDFLPNYQTKKTPNNNNKILFGVILIAAIIIAILAFV